MEEEIVETLPTKRRKTESEDEDGTSELLSEETISGDNDSYLQEFLSKKPVSNLSPYQRVIKGEEEEALSRDPDKDLKLYKDACADFSDCVSDIAEIKVSKPEGWKESINDLRKEAAVITVLMKKLNRVEKTRTRISRDKINKERQQTDTARVNLDNMLCEIQHLRKEIDKCLKFGSRQLDIELVPIEEFYEKSPSSISKPEITNNNSHMLQLARLEWELKQRKELSKLLNNLENKRTFVSEQIDKKEKDLNSIGPLVNEVVAVAQPLREKLGSTTVKMTSVAEHAYLLPEPLYFLFVQASAFRDAADKGILVEIKGNFAEAQRFRTQSCEGFSNNQKTAKGASSKQDADEEKRQLLTKHPLSVYIKLTMKERYSLDLQFFYFTCLNLATVKPSITAPSVIRTPSSTDVILNPQNILNNLFPGDSGLDSPNIMNYYQLQKLDVESLPFDSMGFPYIWVQKFVGLNFLGQNEKVEPKQEICRTNLSIIIKELKRRCLHRVSLLTLVAEIEGGDIAAPTVLNKLKPTCQLKSFKGITWAEYLDHPLSERFKNTSYTGSGDLHFQALFVRGDAKLTCLIGVKSDYPQSSCVFAVEIDYEPLNKSQESTSYSLEIEREVNVFWKELLTSRTQAVFLLSYQLFRVMLCFDIVLECCDSELFPSTKNFESIFRGRDRALPFKYLPEENMFAHRK